MTRGFSRLRREDLLKTACEVISSLGFGHTRTLDIARAAGVSQPLLFYHFETKEQLFAEAFSYAAEQHLTSIMAIERAQKPPVERLRALVRLCAPGTNLGGWKLWIDAWAESMRNDQLESTSRKLDLYGRRVLREIIEEGVLSGEMTCPDADAAAWRIFGLIDGLAVQYVVHRKTVTRKRVTEMVMAAAAMEVGLGPGEL
ncbi:TetR/AcrR family transcriptional regulator [Nonomuraea longicatena]|uniref:TetR family transcriptional regulator C-terminal domain-containing protein n=1 Tax=Nonomuraea longicatena TaxID=83682 RepID=A0ABN1NMM7_9ACTN